MFTYKIYIEDNFLGYEYAMTEYLAREKAFNIRGSASKYTGATMDNIKAKRIN